ncbi:hypothetical protein [Novipirellula aureliae]|nr:hypothetical protein [Novipirellula aureliae]
MIRKLIAYSLLACFIVVPLVGCGGQAAGVPDATQSERDKYKAMQAEAEAEAANYTLDPTAKT